MSGRIVEASELRVDLTAVDYPSIPDRVFRMVVATLVQAGEKPVDAFRIAMQRLLGLFLIGLLIFPACKGPVGSKGDKGDTGIQGSRGPGDMEVISGPVISDDFVVTDSRIAHASQINVYLNTSGSLVQMPIYLPALGLNALYIATPSASKIELFRSQLAGASQYVIVIII